MKYFLVAAAIVPFATGCVEQQIIDSLANPPITAGGQVNVTMGTGSTFEVPALAGNKKEPFHVLAQTPAATFWLSAARELAGASVRDTLAEANRSVDVELSPGSANRIEIHHGGTGCVSQSGTIALSTDASGRLHGEFHADGAAPTGGAACRMDGTLGAVPIDPER